MFTEKQIERFNRRILVGENGCLNYTGTTCTIDSKRWKVARVCWIINNGEIPDGFDVRRTCSNRKCVNIAHMYLKKNQVDKRSMITRFWENVIKTDYCWNWVGRVNLEGYGLISENGKQYRANRISYQMKNGPIKNEMLICHKCNNPNCVNPDHLYEGTPKENSQDMILAGHSRKGIKNTNAILNEEKVLQIRKIYKEKKTSYKALSINFEVSEATIGQIIRRDTWTHI